jgi:hypothetical protein
LAALAIASTSSFVTSPAITSSCAKVHMMSICGLPVRR